MLFSSYKQMETQTPYLEAFPTMRTSVHICFCTKTYLYIIHAQVLSRSTLTSSFLIFLILFLFPLAICCLVWCSFSTFCFFGYFYLEGNGCSHPFQAADRTQRHNLMKLRYDRTSQQQQFRRLLYLFTSKEGKARNKVVGSHRIQCNSQTSNPTYLINRIR